MKKKKTRSDKKTDIEKKAQELSIEQLSIKLDKGLARPKKLIVLSEADQRKRDANIEKSWAENDANMASTYSGCVAYGDITSAMKCLDDQSRFVDRCNKNLAISLRINRITKTALDELGHSIWTNDMDGGPCKLSQTNWILTALGEFARGILKDQINPIALDTNRVDRILMLYILWSRATRKVEGYTFSSEDNATRLPLGPSNEI